MFGKRNKGLIDSIMQMDTKMIAKKAQVEEDPIDDRSEYTMDMDVHRYNRYIISKFDKDIQSNTERDKKIEEIKKNLLQPLKGIDRTKLQRDLTKIQEEKQAVVEKKKRYIKEVAPILDEYDKMTKDSTRKFGDTTTNLELRSIIKSFVYIAREYAGLICVEKMPDDWKNSNKCPYCFTEMSEMEDESFYCTTCDIYLSMMCSEKEIDPSYSCASGKKGSYEPINNFRDALNAYQGLQEKVLPASLFDTVEEYIRDKGIDKETLTPRDIRDIFKVTDNSAYYDDVHLFLHEYIGRPLANVADIQDQIVEDCQVFLSEYFKTRSGRKSSLNTQFMLWVFLTKNGHICNYSDFKIPDTEPIEMRNKESLINVFQSLGWEYSSFI